MALNRCALSPAPTANQSGSEKVAHSLNEGAVPGWPSAVLLHKQMVVRDPARLRRDEPLPNPRQRIWASPIPPARGTQTASRGPRGKPPARASKGHRAPCSQRQKAERSDVVLEHRTPFGPGRGGGRPIGGERQPIARGEAKRARMIPASLPSPEKAAARSIKSAPPCLSAQQSRIRHSGLISSSAPSSSGMRLAPRWKIARELLSG